MGTDAISQRLTWPPTRDELARLVAELGIHGAARAYGRPRGTVKHWCKRWGIASPHPPGTSVTLRRTRGSLDTPSGVMDVEYRDRLLAALRRGPVPLAELADALDRGPSTVQAMLDALRREGYQLVQRGTLWALDREPVAAEAETPLPAPVDGHIRIGIVSDTHLGSKYQQLSYLRETYGRFEGSGVQEVYHVGDVLDGVDVYRGQHAEQFLHTYDEQIDYAVEHYPRASFRTKVIGGNHDLAGVRRGDSDPLRRLASQRPDIEYLGPYSAWPQLSHLLMYLLHPDGPAAYAISYKLQKIVESFEGGRKPHVLAVGHWHQMAYFHSRNVHAFYPGTFQAQTEHERRKALQPQVGAVLLDIQVADDGSWHEVTPRFFRFFVPKEHDY